MKVCLTGGTGFIGCKVKKLFEENGYVVCNLTRKDFKLSTESLADKMEGADLIINLAGASIQKKWTVSYKKEIFNSRILTTRKLAEAIHLLKQKPSLVMSASAVGIYDTFENHDEFSDNFADDFLAHVCKEWETAIAPVANEKTRLAIIRLGVVLDKEQGALKKMLPPFKAGLGAVIGDGYQPFPFIHIYDLLSIIWYLYLNTSSKGVYNLVAPKMASNREFSKTLGKVLKRPVWMKLTKGMLKMIMGEGASMVIKGQKVIPQRLIEQDYPFLYPDIDSALENLLK